MATADAILCINKAEYLTKTPFSNFLLSQKEVRSFIELGVSESQF